MTIIQGGPKPIVAVPVDTALRSAEMRDNLPTKPLKPIAKGDAAARYTAEREPDDPQARGRKVDVDA